MAAVTGAVIGLTSAGISTAMSFTQAAQQQKLFRQANAKAEQAMTIRLEHMNEFRDQINKERAEYVRREVLDKELKLIDTRFKSLERTKAFSEGKMWMVMAAFSAIPLIVALIALFR